VVGCGGGELWSGAAVVHIGVEGDADAAQLGGLHAGALSGLVLGVVEIQRQGVV
jgi:hypothetical protein